MNSLIDSIKKLDHRLDWNEYFMAHAYLASNRSSCDRLHVGCVIVCDNRIVTTGYNGHIKGAPHASVVKNGHEQMTIHAETNAIADAASRGIKLKGATTFVTHYPCINCAKNLIASGISEIIYGEDYHNDELCKELYIMAGVKVNKYVKIAKDQNVIKSNFRKVAEFHQCAGHPVNNSHQLSIFNDKPERVALRLKLILEEVHELEDAVKQKNFTEVIDALCDITYVVNGMGLEFGIDLDKAFDIVHRSNMTKFCKDENEAIETVEWYKKQYQEGKSKYKNPSYRKSPDSKHWVVFDADTDKALKSINYTPVNFDSL